MNFDLSKIEFSKFDINRNLKLPEILEEKIAEDIGIMVGDGHISKLIRPKRAVDYQIMCFGNAITDRPFYENHVRRLKNNLFNLNFTFAEQKKNTCMLRIYSRGLLEFYTTVFDLPLGKKDNVGIPSLIMKAKKKIKCSFIRGLGDTDFSLVFRRKNRELLYYPSVKINTSSRHLISDLKKILDDLGFNFTISYDLKSTHPKTRNVFITHSLCLNGNNNLKRWMQVIGTNNLKNLLKYNLWKKQGFCPNDKEIRKIMSGPEGIRTPDLLT